MTTYKEIDCLKCETFIKPGDRNCEECFKVYNEHREKLVIDGLNEFSKDALITKLYNRMTVMEKIILADQYEKKSKE